MYTMTPEELRDVIAQLQELADSVELAGNEPAYEIIDAACERLREAAALLEED